MSDALHQAWETISKHSKSFSFAARLFPPELRMEAAVVYAYCRQLDDAIDLAGSQAEAERALAEQRELLFSIFHTDEPLGDAVLEAFRDVARRRRIPERYVRDLVDGMEMDVRGEKYASIDDLLLYCYRAAGTVGLMMSHVMGVADPRALRHAAHLGIGMQLTNICRDVKEDRERGRVYLPGELLADFDDARGRKSAVATLLYLAEGYYCSGDEGLPSLHWRCALAVDTARRIYSAIGDELAARNFDPMLGRVSVSGPKKLFFAVAALASAGVRALQRFIGRAAPFRPVPLPTGVETNDLLRL